MNRLNVLKKYSMNLKNYTDKFQFAELSKKLLTAAIMVVRSIFLPLCSEFLSVFEGEPHILLAVDGHEIYQSAPEGGIEGVHQFSLCQGFEESLDLCPARLLAADGLIQDFVPSLGSIEPCGQPVIAFLVFDLVEGNMSVFVGGPKDAYQLQQTVEDAYRQEYEKK